MELANFDKWEDILENIENISPAEWFRLGEQLTKDLEHYEEQKRETRRIYNVAVANYNHLVEIADQIKDVLYEKEASSDTEESATSSTLLTSNEDE